MKTSKPTSPARSTPDTRQTINAVRPPSKKFMNNMKHEVVNKDTVSQHWQLVLCVIMNNMEKNIIITFWEHIVILKHLDASLHSPCCWSKCLTLTIISDERVGDGFAAFRADRILQLTPEVELRLCLFLEIERNWVSQLINQIFSFNFQPVTWRLSDNFKHVSKKLLTGPLQLQIKVFFV